nr:NAD(P)H-binding protein [Snodgrassella alvi]
MFKIFVGRDKKRPLKAEQLSSLAQRFIVVWSKPENGYGLSGIAIGVAAAIAVALCCAGTRRGFCPKLSQQGVATVIGDATDESSVKKACELAGKHTVIVSTLGGSAGAHYLAQRLIIDTAEHCGIKQMLLVTSLGCGDSWATMSERAKKLSDIQYGKSLWQKYGCKPVR